MSIRIAILGGDSAHAEIYTSLCNPKGSPLYGRARVETLYDPDPAVCRKMAVGSVRVAGSPAEALAEADLALICSRWGEDHALLAEAAMDAGRPVYIDKPLTNDLAEARGLLARADAAGVPAFSASPLRFDPAILSLREKLGDIGPVLGGYCGGVAETPLLGPRGQNVYFYGVHLVDIAHTVFGPGARTVRVDPGPAADHVSLEYGDGKTIGLTWLRDCDPHYAVTVHGTSGALQAAIDDPGAFDGPFYPVILEHAVRMAETGLPPIPFSHAVEVIAILDAIEHARTAPGQRIALAC